MLDKSKIREEILSKRRSLREKELRAMSKEIQKRLFFLPEFQESRTISLYVDFDNEVRTKDMIKDCIDKGKRVVIPFIRSKDRAIILSEVKDIDKELEPSTFGILEPAKGYFRPVPYNEIDTVVVPGVAFDAKGGRLGYGGGYYDRLLINVNRKAHLIGLAFEFQILKEVPQQSHDIVLESIITEKRIINCFSNQN